MPSGIYTRTKKHKKLISKGLTGRECSQETRKKISEATKGRISPNKGIPCPEKTKRKISIANKGRFTEEKSIHWKGDNIKIGSLHDWIKSKLGKPTKCEHCGKDGLTSHQIHWINKDHTYKRNTKDWLRLCISCHAKHDKKKKLRYHNYDKTTKTYSKPDKIRQL